MKPTHKRFLEDPKDPIEVSDDEEEPGSQQPATSMIKSTQSTRQRTELKTNNIPKKNEVYDGVPENTLDIAPPRNPDGGSLSKGKGRGNSHGRLLNKTSTSKANQLLKPKSSLAGTDRQHNEREQAFAELQRRSAKAQAAEEQQRESVEFQKLRLAKMRADREADDVRRRREASPQPQPKRDFGNKPEAKRRKTQPPSSVQELMRDDSNDYVAMDDVWVDLR